MYRIMLNKLQTTGTCNAIMQLCTFIALNVDKTAHIWASHLTKAFTATHAVELSR